MEGPLEEFGGGMRKKVNEKDWSWDGRPGHFVGSDSCYFHLATQVGGALISTIGEYRPVGMTKMWPIGEESDFFYETMVFPCEQLDKDTETSVLSWKELECRRQKNYSQAVEEHYKMCEKWSKSKYQRKVLSK